jgi:hypothetical protein
VSVPHGDYRTREGEGEGPFASDTFEAHPGLSLVAHSCAQEKSGLCVRTASLVDKLRLETTSVLAFKKPCGVKALQA